MAEYTPPLRDIKFVLSNIVDLAGLASLKRFEHADPDTVFGALDEGGRFMAEVVAPTNTIGDKEGVALSEDGVVVTPEAFKAVYQSYVQAGWGAVPFPPEFGGHGFPWVVGLSIQEMLAASNMAFSLNPMLTQGAIEAVLLHGSEELQAIYLEKLITAEWSGTMCLTEPQAGSDLGVVRTKAIPQDDGTYRITGQKIFITWGDHDLSDNVIHLVLATRTQARHPCQSDLRARFRRRRRFDRLSGRRRVRGHEEHVHDDEQRSPIGRSPGSGYLGAGISGRSAVRTGTQTGQSRGNRTRHQLTHHRAPRCAANAHDPTCVHRSNALSDLHQRRGHGHCTQPPR